MASRVYIFHVTCPAGTAVAAPVTQDCSFNQAEVQEIEVIIPDGHAGLTGLQLQQAHQAVIPYNAGGYIHGNDEQLRFAVEDYIDNGNWQALMYNIDVYDHSWDVRFYCGNAAQPAAPAAPVVAPYLAGLPTVPPPAADAGVPAVP